MRRAFVSHSTADDSYVAELESFLRAAGYDEVFNDVRSIPPDATFWPVIEKGIADADTLVVVITAASNASEWVKREVEYARDLSKKIIPVWIEDCPVPPIFADRDVIDFRPRIRAERRFEISRIVKSAPAELIGRENETKLLNDAWQKVLRVEKGRPHVLTFVALGGEGKTSLIAKWAAELAHQDWPGCDAAFAWSFYSQGTREQVAASSDLFLKEALTFFGDDEDKEFAASPAGAYEKGQRLARIVGRRRSLLILDGLEPLQYAPTSPTPGQLKDQGIAALLKGLAAASHGLCIVTTRYSLPDLRAFWQTTAPELPLPRLSRAAGVHLLQSFGVKGSPLSNRPLKDGDETSEKVNEFEKLVEDVQGHALTLNLLGTYLRDAHAGDIRKRDLVKLEEADAEEQGGHAFRVMAAYESEFEREGDKGQRALAVLRLLGLFDRPLTSDCLYVLLQAPAIPELTEPLVGLTEAQRNLAFKRLEDARLLTVNREASGALLSLDNHALLREYFAHRVCKQQPEAWRAAHQRLCVHLCETTSDKKPNPTLQDLQPLYQAVAHGCQGGLYNQALTLFTERIQRGGQFYSSKKLGAFGADLSAVAYFFEQRWTVVSPLLSESKHAHLIGFSAYTLRGLGRLIEALEPAQVVLAMRVNKKEWLGAAYSSNALSELQLTLGSVAAAVPEAQKSVKYAEGTRVPFQLTYNRSTFADAMHKAGHRKEANSEFRRAETSQPQKRPLNSLQGFRYSDLLISNPEREAWRMMYDGFPKNAIADQIPQLIKLCREGDRRATLAIQIAKANKWLLDIGLAHLTISRASLYTKLLEGSHLRLADSDAIQAVDYFRRSGHLEFTPLGLLTRGWWRFLTSTRTGPDSALSDLDEAWEIAERGTMKLFLADIHLHRARLFFREAQYPWESPQADLAAAEKLINDCGYHRRDEELADAKAAILSR